MFFSKKQTGPLKQTLEKSDLSAAALPAEQEKVSPQEATELLLSEEALRRGEVTIHDLIAPAAMRVDSSYLELSGVYVRTIFTIEYPRYIAVGWFAPILNFSATLDIGMFFYPVEAGIILKQLRNRAGNLEAQLSANQEKGAPRDPMLETALGDIEKLRDDLTQGVEHFFQYALYVTVYAKSKEELDILTEKIESLFGSRLVFTRRGFYQTEQGFNATLPLANDELGIGFNMNSSPCASSYPFISSELSSDTGVLYGINRHNNSLIIFDRFSLQNANSVVFATSGAGKSVHRDTEVLVKNAHGVISRQQIGDLIDGLGKDRGFETIDEELEGVINPGIFAYTFDRHLKGVWSPVTVAARKTAPQNMHVIKTQSGRSISVTGDHNMLVLRKGEVTAAKSTEVRMGEYLPLPRKIYGSDTSPARWDTLSLLAQATRVYVDGFQAVIAKHYIQLKSAGINRQFDPYLLQYSRKRPVPIQYFWQLAHFLEIQRNDICLKGLTLVSRTKRHNVGLPAYMEATPAVMRIIGYIISEGTINSDFILISNKDKEVIEDIKHCLAELNWPWFQRQSDQSFVLAGRICVEFLKALGIRGRSHSKQVPGCVFELPDKLAAEFLRAYFEGDGGVEKHTVSACTKSPQLASDLAYLLMRFGIIARLQQRQKTATNSGAVGKYWIINISGQEHLQRYREVIGFITQRKNKLLQNITNKIGNTNVDVLPISDVLSELYAIFGSQLKGLQSLIDIKNSAYQPSRAVVKRLITQIEERIDRFIALQNQLSIPANLPALDQVLAVGQEPTHNHKLWSVLGESWRLMKYGLVNPRANNVLKAIKVIYDLNYSVMSIKQAIHSGYKALSLSIVGQGRSLAAALTQEGMLGNNDYGLLFHASQTVCQEYQRTAQQLPRVRQLIQILQRLVDADLFWDKIVSIEQQPNDHEYVYDLTVDNEVFLAGHGGLFVHNSYAIKLEVLRSLMQGTDVIIIDPEMEYKYLSDAVGGTYISVSLASESKINPFDLPRPRRGSGERAADIIRSAVITLKGLIRLMLGDLTRSEDSLVDRALIETYRQKDITGESDLETVESPTMKDFQEVLEGMEGAGDLVVRLKKYTEGTFVGFLNYSTNIDLRNQLIVFSVRDLEDELKPIAIYTIVNYIWNVVRSELKKRLMVIDEAWWLLQREDSAKFVYALVKRCRKYYLGITTITQDVEDFLNSPYGRAIVTNSAIQILLRQSPAAIATVAKTFNLTEGERYLLLDSEVGEGIFFAGDKHVAIRVVASYSEDQLITSDPRQLLEIEAAKQEFAREQTT